LWWGVRRRGRSSCRGDLLGKQWSALARFSKDLFVDAMECRQLAWFWLEWGWIRDMSDLAYSKREGVSSYFSEWGSSRFGRVFWCVSDVGGVSGVVGRPRMDTNTFLIPCGDFEFRVGDKGVKGFVPPDEEPGVVDKFEG
jgi:hypothetical protein